MHFDLRHAIDKNALCTNNNYNLYFIIHGMCIHSDGYDASSDTNIAVRKNATHTAMS